MLLEHSYHYWSHKHKGCFMGCPMGSWHQQHASPAAVVSGADDALLGPVAHPPLRHGRFSAEPAQAARARHFVRSALAGCASADDATLLTSELFANSIAHSSSGSHGARGSGVHILVCHCCPGSVRITVIDDGSASAPAVRRAGRLRTTGRGLLLVQELAVRWGHDGGEHGRAVWFELDCARPGAVVALGGDAGARGG